MSAFEIVTTTLDLFGEHMLAWATVVLVILILLQNRENKRHYRSVTKPAIVVHAEANDGESLIRFKNWGGGPAVDVHALLGRADEDRPNARMIDLGLMAPYGEHVQSLGSLDGAFGSSFKVALYYRDSDNIAHHYDFILTPRAVNDVSIVGEEHEAIKAPSKTGWRGGRRSGHSQSQSPAPAKSAKPPAPGETGWRGGGR